ncbi:hypothetical protein PVK06_032328 [Gossypium arboreum]|uniref:Geraniol 8-hydroxylase-like n=1 Tax=Gossypium arboreum TaxID=29729 RepID=A0ABR0NTG8_GOSAR|nr:hypothetical protein PVK06_032328 [Gossypium arboreum]
MDLLTSSLLCLLFTWLLLQAFNSFRYGCKSSQHKLPPGPWPKPIISNLFDLGDKPHRSLAKLAQIHGPVMSLKLGSLITVVLSSETTAKEILSKQDLIFSSRTTVVGIRACHTMNLECHGYLCPHFGELFANSVKGEAVNIGQAAFDTTINLLSNTIFSMDLVDPNSSIAREFKETVCDIMVEIGKPNLADYFPLLTKLDPQDGIEELNKTHVTNLLLDLFVAGTDTTSSTLEWAMAELLRNPQALLKAKKELDEAIGKGNPVEESDVNRLPYLQAIIKETFRMHPAVPLLLPRRADSDANLCGFKIPKGSQVLINVWAIGRDPSIWDNPNSFIPDRFLGSEIDVKGRDFGLIPFGAGRRICPGLPLANRMLHLMLGSLINYFDWKLEGEISPNEMNMEEKYRIAVHMATPLRAIPLLV